MTTFRPIPKTTTEPWKDKAGYHQISLMLSGQNYQRLQEDERPYSQLLNELMDSAYQED